MAETFQVHFKPKAGKLARAAQKGERKILEGKMPLPFDLYRRMCFETLKSAKPEGIFFRCFILLSWNQMSRSASTVSVQYDHIGWVQDSLLIFMAHQKNDQLGIKPRNPKHCYSKPISPEICPVLGLGIYFSTHGISAGGAEDASLMGMPSMIAFANN